MSCFKSHKFLWLILIAAKVLECKIIESDITKNGKTTLENVEIVEKVFLKRKKRFLIFEKGATAFVQTNIAKSIISAIPRGLNEITEYTLNYDLPWELEIPKVLQTKKLTTTASTTTRTTTTMKSTTADASFEWWNYYDKHSASFDNSEWHSNKKLWCPKEHIFQKYYDSSGKNALPWCNVENFQYKKVGKKWKRSVLNSNSPQETTSKGTTLLFDLITHFADIHGYNARHCIMRTLCESRHLLLPPGRLLFHDLVRILLSYAQPAMRRHAPFRAAIHRENLQECMQLYGLHCRWSFLQHFTESIGTAANSMVISPILLRSIQHAEFM